MITVDDINKIVSAAEENGMSVKMCDISYIILSGAFSESQVAYAVLFGKEKGEDEASRYAKSMKVKFLKKLMKPMLDGMAVTSARPEKKPSHKDISFEENKDALINLLRTIKDMKEKGEIEAKDAVKLETDIRIKLNDKFDVSAGKHEKRVVVNAKYNHICGITRKECWLQTKEFAMEHWGLIEKNNNSVGDNN